MNVVHVSMAAPRYDAGTMEERRAHPRVPVELRVAYRKLNGFFADYTRNISRGGTFIPTTRTVEPGTVFRFHLEVPGRPEPFALEGVVVRNAGPDEQPGVGIRFRWQDEAARRRFEEAVEAMLVASFGEEVARRMLDRGTGDGH